MKTITTLLLVLCTLDAAFGGDRGVLPVDFHVSVVTSAPSQPRSTTPRMLVTVTISRNPNMLQGDTSTEVKCFDFPVRSRSFQGSDLKAFHTACDAAGRGDDFNKEILTDTVRGKQRTSYEVVDHEGGRMVLVRRGGHEALFEPAEGLALRKALDEAKIAEAWYQKLLNAKVVPEHMPEARPPHSEGYILIANLGEVSGRGITFTASIMGIPYGSMSNYQYHYGLRFSTDHGHRGWMSGEWVAGLLHRVTAALEATSDGRKYSFVSGDDDGRKYTITGNLETNEADIVLFPGNQFDEKLARRGHFGEKQLKVIRGFVGDDEDLRWFENHERLFFIRPSEEKPNKTQ